MKNNEDEIKTIEYYVTWETLEGNHFKEWADNLTEAMKTYNIVKRNHPNLKEIYIYQIKPLEEQPSIIR
jgi:hypothetical protein